MKTLVLIRHAKSSWDNPTGSDFDRPLNKRGLKAAPLVGAHLRQKRIRPDLVLASPAERARQTASLVCEASGFGSDIRYDERIYLATWTSLMLVLNQIEESVQTALIVGHNPGMEDLLLNLTGATRPMATATAAKILLNCEHWSDVKPGSGKLEWLIKPKDIDG